MVGGWVGQAVQTPLKYQCSILARDYTFDFDDTLWCDLSYSDWANKVPRVDLEDSFTNITGSVFC
jgi:hypothetical protein